MVKTSFNLGLKEIAIYTALVANSALLSGCASSQKGYYELQREALNPQEQKQLTLDDIAEYATYECLHGAVSYLNYAH